MLVDLSKLLLRELAACEVVQSVHNNAFFANRLQIAIGIIAYLTSYL